MLNVDVPVNGNVVFHSNPKANNGSAWLGAVSYSQDVNTVGLFGAPNPQDITLHGQNVPIGQTAIVTVSGAGQFGQVTFQFQVTASAPLPPPPDPNALNHFEPAVDPATN